MIAKCINCGKQIEANQEFCESCSANLEIMVDAQSSDNQSNYIETTRNVLFQTGNVTGNVISGDEDIIKNRLNRDTGNNNNFWIFLFSLVFLMALIVAFFT